MNVYLGVNNDAIYANVWNTSGAHCATRCEINIYLGARLVYDFSASLRCVSVANNGNAVQSNEQDVEQCVDRGGNELQRSIEISKCGCVKCLLGLNLYNNLQQTNSLLFELSFFYTEEALQ